MNREELLKRFELEAKEMNAYVDSVIKTYTDNGIKPADTVKSHAQTVYILAMINKLKGGVIPTETKGESNVKRTSRKKTKSTSNNQPTV